MADDKKSIKGMIKKKIKSYLNPKTGKSLKDKIPVSQVQKGDAKSLNQMKQDKAVKNATTSNPTPQNKMGASPSERKRISNANKSEGLKGSTKRKGTAGGAIKGEADKDRARLLKQKKDAKIFEKSLKGKRDKQFKNTRDPLFDTISKYMSGGGTVYKGR